MDRWVDIDKKIFIIEIGSHSYGGLKPSPSFSWRMQESQSYNSVQVLKRPENLGNWWYNSRSNARELGAASIRTEEHGHPKEKRNLPFLTQHYFGHILLD